MDDLISRAAVLDAIDGMKPMQGNMEQLAMKALCWAAVKSIPTVDAAPVEWLEYMQKECLSENDRAMVNAIEAILIEWHLYVHRLREMDRQKEQEAR